MQLRGFPLGMTTQDIGDAIVSPMASRVFPKRQPKITIAQFRKRRKMSQERLAEEIGTTKGSISRWEKGERDITLNALAAIAETLGCSIGDLAQTPGHKSADDLLSRLDPSLRRRALRQIEALIEGEPE